VIVIVEVEDSSWWLSECLVDAFISEGEVFKNTGRGVVLSGMVETKNSSSAF
jgi:hypothetical protein